MATSITEPAYWSITQKIAFRFFLLFFLLYIFFNPNGVIPFYDGLFKIYIQPFHRFIPWIAAHILGLDHPITVFTAGSGDTTYDYVVLLFITLVSFMVTIVWSVTDRSARNYNKLCYWLSVIVRYYVAITMVTYGSVKVFKLQFPSSGFGKLVEPLGDMSPMGLAWAYMGYSAGFNYFTGIAELSCGLLLFFRKTTTLGAIIGLIIAMNIMAVNYCFDVPVKLLSTCLVLMCIFLLIRDTRRLVNFFLKNKEALPSDLSPHRFKAKWKNITLMAAKYILVAYVVVGQLVSKAVFYSYSYAKKNAVPLYGLYDVETFVRNGDTLAPLTTDTIRWRKFMTSAEGEAGIKMMNDSIKYYNFTVDTVEHSIIASSDVITKRYFLTYIAQKPDVLIMKGLWNKDSIYVRMHKMDPNNFQLLKRGFHMINEHPYNK
ncbi:MAG: hypothetical protein ACXVJD_17560 [Mucilaginibacter sp.]